MNSDEHEYEYLKKTGAVPSDDKLKDQVNGSHKIDPSKNSDPSQRPRQKSHRHDENFDHQVKHSTIKDESDQDENDWNSSLSSHLFSIGRERNEREKSRRRRESKNRDRVREDKSRKKKVGDKIRERNGDRCSDGGKRNRDSVYVRDTEKEREQERSNRDRNRSERYRAECDRERSQDKGRSYDMEYKEIEPMSEVRENVPESRRIKEEKEEVPESEADDERDKRTVFAYQISLKADEKDVYEFFSRAGKVRDVRLIMDRNSRCSKGVGYIEFYDVMSVPVAIALSGQSLLGQPVMVKPSEAEKNLVQSTTVAAGKTGLIGCYSWEGRQLHVSNLHVNIKEDQLHEVFEPFGKIELVQLPLDRETRQRKGYGFVQFARHEDARAALSLDGQLEIAGHVMKVSATADHTNGQEVVASAGDFDDDRSDGMGVAGSVGAAPAISPPFVPIGQIPIPVPAGFPTSTFSIPDALPLSYTIGNPSECLLLKNMFDPKLEPEPDFDQDIKDDVKDKCTKFGELKHVYVDKNSAGFVYLRFQQSESALAAQRALHGRWFAGKMITATFLVPENYNTKFPESK